MCSNAYKKQEAKNSYSYSIDFLRYIASLSVLIWHYQHFYFPSAGVVGSANEILSQPMYDLLHFFYTKGYYGVQVFWVISGYVFIKVYINRPCTTQEFVLFRFARLYPLHFLTLILVTILQCLSLSTLGHAQIYPSNDVYHFLLNIFFISGWGFQKGWSFNAPIWSVSVEILSYTLFWLVLPLIRKTRITILIVFILSLLTQKYIYQGAIIDCIIWFFLGCLVYVLSVHDIMNRNPYLTILSTASLLALFSINETFDININKYFIIFLIVFFFSRFENFANQKISRMLYLLGSLSYGMYLWHIPLQIVLMSTVQYFGIKNPYSHFYFLVLYALLLHCIAYSSFNFFENPLRIKIKKIYLRRHLS